MTNHEIGDCRTGATKPENGVRFFIRFCRAERFELLEYILIFLLSRASLFGAIAPFGLAYYAATFPKHKRLYGILFSCVGILFSDFGVGALKYLSSVAIVSTFSLLLSEELYTRQWVYGLIASVACAINGFIYAYFDGFLLYDVLVILVEAIGVFLCYFVFFRASHLLRTIGGRRIFENEELFTLLFLISVTIISISSIPYLAGAAHALAVLAVMSFSLTDGAGRSAMAGALLGLLISTTEAFPSQVVGVYGICALVSGCFRRYGKWGVSISFFITNVLVMLYFNNGTMMFIAHSHVLIAAIALFFLPSSWVSVFGAVLKAPALMPDENEQQRMRGMIEERLTEAATSFSVLSDTFRDVMRGKKKAGLKDIDTVFEKTTEMVCKNCSMHRYCWQKNGEKTKKMLASMVPVMQERGYAADIDTDKHFRENCLKIERFLRVLNSNYEVYKVNRMWAGKVRESRELLADQFENVSSVLQGIRSNLYDNMEEAKELEHKIAVALDRKGIDAQKIRVCCGDGYEVSMQVKACEGKLICAKSIAATIGEVLGVPMLRINRSCGEEICKLKFREVERFSAEIGVSYTPRDGEQASGDSFLSTYLSDGKQALALSDGMGSGEEASSQSKMTVALMERLLDAGFDKETTLRLINSALLSNSVEESFATVDMCLFNSYTGALEFIKIGAASSYIKSKDGVRCVCSTSLPAGIIGRTEPDCELHYGKDGDYVVLVTDGVSDVFERVGKTTMEKMIASVRVDSAQMLADVILMEAIRQSGGKAGDDMTVLCAKISECM